MGKNLAALDRHPWSGHSALLCRVRRPWQAVLPVLGQCVSRVGEARNRYRAFVAAGIERGRPELQGSGLVRSVGGMAGGPLPSVWAADERILGSSGFVEEIQQAESAQGPSLPWSRAAGGARWRTPGPPCAISPSSASAC